MTQVNYCPRNPKKETNLRCNRCEEYICSDCMVQTPVGARCPTCARSTPIPTYNVTATYRIRGIAAGVVSAAVLGGAFYFLTMWTLTEFVYRLYPYPQVAAIVGIGIAIGEVISLAVNRKKGRILKIVSSCSVLVAIFITTYTLQSTYGMHPYVMLSIAGAFWLSLRRF